MLTKCSCRSRIRLTVVVPKCSEAVSVYKGVLIRAAKMQIPVNIDATTTWLEKVSDSEYVGG